MNSELIAQVKTALRISHDKLDDEIGALIQAAQSELYRLGVHPAHIQEPSDPLIIEAVKTYCKYNFTDDEKKRELFYKSWETQVDAIRKSGEYAK